MAISDRISAMYDHVGEIYDTLELGGDTTENKNIVNINTEIKREYKNFLAYGTDELWNNWEKVSGSGETLTLNNTMEGKMKVDLKGNTYQYTTTGKNLLNYIDNLRTPYSGLTSTINEDGSITTTGLPNGSYRCIVEYNINNILENGQTYIFWQQTPQAHLLYMQVNAIKKDGTGTSYYSLNTGDAYKTFVANTNTYNYIMNIQTENIWDSSKTITNKYMLEKSNTKTSFEPYTNGASPNPDYPQDIQVVSGDNTLKVEGKNLFDKSTSEAKKFVRKSDGTIQSSNDWSATDYIQVQPSTQYIYSGITNGWSGNAGTSFYDNSKTFISSINSTEQTFTTPNNAKYVRISLNTETPTNVMLEKGTQPSTYTPYVSQTYPITLPVGTELCKIGDYQDRIYKDSGKWYLHKEIGKVVLNGSEEWNSSTSNYYTVINNAMLSSQGYSNYFINSSTLGTFGYFRFSGSQHWLIFMSVSSQYTSQQWKDWLSNNNTTVYYILATPTTTEITDSTLLGQLNALEDAKSYDNQTNINQVNNDLASVLNATALEQM